MYTAPRNVKCFITVLLLPVNLAKLCAAPPSRLPLFRASRRNMESDMNRG